MRIKWSKDYQKPVELKLRGRSFHHHCVFIHPWLTLYTWYYPWMVWAVPIVSVHFSNKLSKKELFWANNSYLFLITLSLILQCTVSLTQEVYTSLKLLVLCMNYISLFFVCYIMECRHMHTITLHLKSLWITQI